MKYRTQDRHANHYTTNAGTYVGQIKIVKYNSNVPSREAILLMPIAHGRNFGLGREGLLYTYNRLKESKKKFS